MKMRIRALLLAAMMVVSLLPAVSMATVKEAKIGDTEYDTLAQAIAAATDGQTVEVLVTEINDTVRVETLQADAAITIQGNGALLKGGMFLGSGAYESLTTPVQNGVKVTGFKFQTKGLAVAGLTDVEILDNEFDDITTNVHSYPCAIGIFVYVCDDVKIDGNTVQNTREAGINCTKIQTKAVISNNTVKNTQHNGIQITGKSGATAVVTGNTIENWARGVAGEGRAFRGQANTDADFTITGNDMIHSGTPAEGYVKISNITAEATINVNNNYWNGLDDLTGKFVVENTGDSDVTSTYAPTQIATSKVNVAPVYGGPVMNWVKVNAAENGVVKSGPLAASAGATITLYPKASTGYVLDTVEVLDAEGNALELDGLKFQVPLGGVTVNATFKLAE